MKHDVKTFNLFSLSIQELENFVFQSISNFVFHIISLAQQKAQVAYKKIILRLPLIRKSNNSINVYYRQPQAKQKKNETYPEQTSIFEQENQMVSDHFIQLNNNLFTIKILKVATNIFATSNRRTKHLVK